MLSRSLTHGVLPKMRKLYSRFVQDPVSNCRLLLALVKFFIVHGEGVGGYSGCGLGHVTCTILYRRV